MAQPKKSVNSPVRTALAPEPIDLKDACVTAAHAVIAEHGIEKLSLRDVARRLNVSHQAPYKHYPSRDHLLAEVIRRCFQRFTAALNGRAKSAEPIQDMHALGESYLRFALGHPLEYRLMFGTPWPQVGVDQSLVIDSRHSFDVLRQAMTPLYPKGGASKDKIDMDAMFVWSTIHGLATILQSQVMHHLDMNDSVIQLTVPHVMQMMDKALMASIEACA